eukprot:1159461-Pelagomonas_calceolata.AAC.1
MELLSPRSCWGEPELALQAAAPASNLHRLSCSHFGRTGAFSNLQQKNCTPELQLLFGRLIMLQCLALQRSIGVRAGKDHPARGVEGRTSGTLPTLGGRVWKGVEGRTSGSLPMLLAFQNLKQSCRISANY